MKDFKTGVKTELDSRFAHQDEIADNMSKFMTTFQDT